MTLGKSIYDLAGVTHLYKDQVTGEDVSWETVYDRVIDTVGYELIKLCIPYTLDELIAAYQRDKHFNDMGRCYHWDRASGVEVLGNKPPRIIGSNLITLLYGHGVTQVSQAGGVCILKRCAARMVLEVLASKEEHNEPSA